MDIEKLIKIYDKFKYGESLYHKLMNRRIRKILLISTFYNAFVLEEESKFSDQIIGGYHQFNLTTIPKIKNAINASHAIEILKNESFDLVISTLRIGEPDVFTLSKIIKETHESTAFILLFTESFDFKLLNNKNLEFIDNAFLWTGDSSLFLTMIKSVEDKWNVANDTEIGAVSVILLIEDSINFYSIYLPEIYKMLMTQTQKLIEEETNNDIKYLRMRTRPKILHAKNFSEAKEFYEKYKDYLLCVITDMELGDNKNAGIEIIDFVKQENPFVPILAQSSDAELLSIARNKNVEISHKNTPFVLNDFHNFLIKNCGFGDFVFRTEKGDEIAVAKTFNEFEKLLAEIPIESFKYHSDKKDFCTWLVPRRELTLVKKLRKIKREKFKSIEKHRRFLLNVVKNIKIRNRRGKILDFNNEDIADGDSLIFKIGDGSLGGKGRGLSFLNALFSVSKMRKKFKDSIVSIPKSFIITTNYFDEFLFNNYLYLDYDFHSDEEIVKFFQEAELSENLKAKLSDLLKVIKKPIIVRSSGLLEDSQFHPFAGIYKSVILPNCSNSFHKRLEQLEDAIKLVYASVYFKETRAYINRIGLKLEEEKMAVIIQEVIGEKHKHLFYPDFAGVAQSFNYYPIANMDKNDGVATMALGFGKYVVEGEKCYRFCPKHPEIRYLSDEDMVKLTQTEFYALDLNKGETSCKREESFLLKVPVKTAEKNQSFNHIASTLNIENMKIEPGTFSNGPKIINFDNMLLYDSFPLSEIINEILTLSEIAMGTPVEIEFAANITDKLNFYILQVRPLIAYEEMNFNIEELPKEDILVYSEKGCGNGKIEHLKNILFLEPELFEKTETLAMQKEINEFNMYLKEKNEEYILIGPGRWGSRDRFLGIPVNWEDIDMVKVVVECGIEDFDIDPSQGTHFIHNIISMNIGYFNVPYYAEDNNFIDWNWLKSQKSLINKKFFKLICFEKPLNVFMDGKNGKYAIMKP